jgi:DNA topoisomerase-6 subunit B
VPFTSESKEAIADYDEIRKEIKLALQECGRRLGVFLRRRERAKSEFRRRNIFELYIEEVVEACARLKGGKLAMDKLRTQLQKIAAKRTGGAKTGEILGLDGGGPEGLPHSIVLTPEGPEAEAGTLPDAEPGDAATEPPRPEEDDGKAPAPPKPTRGRAAAKPVRRAETRRARAHERGRTHSAKTSPKPTTRARGKKVTSAPRKKR